MRWVLLLAVAGCGRWNFDAVGDGSSGGGSSTRLVPIYNVFEDGPRQVKALYDTLLALRCVPLATTAGLRCLPLYESYVRYQDAACTQPIAPLPSTGAVVPYAYEASYPPIDHVYTPGAAVTTPSLFYQRQYDGTCTPQSGATGAWAALVDTPLDTFAALTPTLGAGTRLRSQQLVADDGFTTPAPLHDTAIDGDCTAAVLDDATVCRPNALAATVYFSDSSCTQAAALIPVPVQFALQPLTSTPCRTTDQRILPITTDVTGAPYWVSFPGSGMCSSGAMGTGERLLDLGAPITQAAVMRAPVASAQRIQLIEDSAAGASAFEPVLWDSQLGVECRPSPAYDATERCIPTSVVAPFAFFSDSGCTQPLPGVPYGPAPCASPLPPLYIEDFSSTRVYMPGARTTGPFWVGTPTACSAFVPTQDIYLIGPEIPPSSFALVTEETGP